MALISTRNHALGDYAGGALLLAAANSPIVRNRRTAALLSVVGAGTLLTSAATDYELGLWRKLPMPAHLAIDAGTGALLAGRALALRRAGAGIAGWLPQVLMGAGEVALAALTDRTPSDGGAATAPAGPGTVSTPTPPQAATGVTGEGLAAQEPGMNVPVAPPPVETPGPSVTPPAEPASDVERAERIDEALPEGAADDDLVAQQEAAAAAEAAAIGGPAPSETGDPAMDPVYQAGGGEQEGWEAAESDLIENASHGEGHGDPARDALTPELESDRSTAVYGESDAIPSTEVVEDPETSGDDPAEGPGVGADRPVD